MELGQLKNIVEAALLAADQPLSTTQLSALFPVEEAPSQQRIREAINQLIEDCHSRGVELVQVATNDPPSKEAPWGCCWTPEAVALSRNTSPSA